jgi:hypothetical protein
MSSGAASSASSEREDRVFTAAFGIMDSAQDGEAVAAFLRVRDILHRHDSGFRRLLERCREADRLNAELGRQNTELLHENAALRARDSRPPVAAANGLPSTPAASGFRHWDIGLIIIIAIWTAFGLLSAATAFALAAAVLIGAAFKHGFSPFRFLAGALLALAAYAIAAPAPARHRQPGASAHPVASATQRRSAPISAVATTAAATEASPRRQPAPFAADQPGRPPAAPQMRYAAQADCSAYGLQSGLNCAGGHRWQRNSFPDFEPSRAVRSD